MDATPIASPEAVIRFWFEDLSLQDWFRSDAALDRRIAERFTATHLALAGHVPDAWRASPEATLALIVVLDQFPRNIYRGTPLAFATDCLALREARAALNAGFDSKVEPLRRAFFYLPFEHSEALEDQDRSVSLFTRLGLEEPLRYAVLHRDAIVEFGRFPHRNAILARPSTPGELEYLARPGAGF